MPTISWRPPLSPAGNAPGKATEVKLAPSTLYDFSKEQLGSNSEVKLPHVKLSLPSYQALYRDPPEQVKGATIFNWRERQAILDQGGFLRESASERQH